MFTQNEISGESNLKRVAIEVQWGLVFLARAVDWSSMQQHNHEMGRMLELSLETQCVQRTRLCTLGVYGSNF